MICFLVGVIIYCVVGFRLTVVRSAAAKEGVTPVNGFTACMYLSLLGSSLFLDMALAALVMHSDHALYMHSYGFGMLIARLLMTLPSVYTISKVRVRFTGGRLLGFYWSSLAALTSCTPLYTLM